jgi:hypothetical protein
MLTELRIRSMQIESAPYIHTQQTAESLTTDDVRHTPRPVHPTIAHHKRRDTTPHLTPPATQYSSAASTIGHTEATTICGGEASTLCGKEASASFGGCIDLMRWRGIDSMRWKGIGLVGWRGIDRLRWLTGFFRCCSLYRTIYKPRQRCFHARRAICRSWRAARCA